MAESFSREKLTQAPQKKVEKSCVTPAGTSTSLTSRINGMTTHTHTYSAAELGRNPVSKHPIQPGYEDEQADAGRACRTPMRPNSQARTGTGKYSFSLFS